jgi:tetratricopeptide (TPR) repeat protein
VGFESGDQEDFDSSLLHQGLIQFIKAFVPNPPLWIQEGLAAYFEQAEYDSSTLSFSLKTDLVWLDTLKNIIRGNSTSSLIPISDLLLIDKSTALEKIEAFYPQVWGMIHFLINSQNNQVNRILWDSIKSMDSDLSMLDNAKKIKDNVFFWYGITKFEQDYKEYILGLKTFAELLKEGMAYYNNNELENAEESFSLALKRESANYIPYYYLGLISYSNKNYSYADQYYNTALQKGAPTALINYALGVNAFADNNFSTAKTYLNEAKKYDPVNYTEKADNLLKRIEGTTE